MHVSVSALMKSSLKSSITSVGLDLHLSMMKGDKIILLAIHDEGIEMTE